MPSTDSNTSGSDQPANTNPSEQEPRGFRWSGKDWLILVLGVLGAIGAIPQLRDVWISLTEIPSQIWTPLNFVQNTAILAALAMLLYKRRRR